MVPFTGGNKEDVAQLEMRAGELLFSQNYMEIDGAYHGYSSVPGYERSDGQALASTIPASAVTDGGNDTRTELLLESDSQSTITDISNNLHTITDTGVINDSSGNNHKFLTSSFYFNGSVALSAADDATLEFGDDDFTLDVLCKLSVAQTSYFIHKEYSYSFSTDGTNILFRYSTNGSSWAGTLTSTATITTGVEYHLAIVRDGTTVYLFIDGVMDDTTLTVGTSIFDDNANAVAIGTSLVGWMDEIRISSTRRWISNFNIPTSPYSFEYYYTFQYDDTAREAQRALIQEVPGNGPVRMVAHLIHDGEDITFAIRDNGLDAFMYEQEITGWSAPEGGTLTFAFENGTDKGGAAGGWMEGDLLTGGTSGATGTLFGIETDSGAWIDTPQGRDAAGHVTLINVTGTFVNGEQVTNADLDQADVVASSIENYTLSPDGVYDHIVTAFDLLVDHQRQPTLFFVNGVDHPTYYAKHSDELRPILHTNLPPEEDGVFACHLAHFKNRLWLGYSDGRLWYSAVGDPLDFDVEVSNAGVIYMEDEITGMTVSPGDALVVFCRNSIQVIKSLTDPTASQTDYTTQALYRFNNENFSQRSGAIPSTIARLLGEMYFLDDRGLTNMTTSDKFGDFTSASVSKNVQNTILSKKNQVLSSIVQRGANQYRLFFNDNSALCFTFDIEKKVKGVTQLLYKTDVYCTEESEDVNGDLLLLFGSSNGYVYQMDSGTSFDGDVIDTKLSTSFHSYKSPTNWKNFKKVTLEAQADKGLTFTGKPEFNYANANIPRSITQDYESVGVGGTWGLDVWGEFIWGSGQVQSPQLYIAGYGTNMSLQITTSNKYTRSHVLNNMIVEYALNARKQ